MRKKQLLALAAAGLLIMQTPVAAMAEVTVSGEDQGTGDVQVDDDVNAEDSTTGVSTDEPDDSATVDGDVTSEDGTAVSASGGSTIIVDGDVTSEGGTAVSASEGSSITVDGDVEGATYGVYAENSNVKVLGDVTTTDSMTSVYSDGGTVTIGGESTGNIIAGFEAQVFVESVVGKQAPELTQEEINAGETPEESTAVMAYDIGTLVQVNGDVTNNYGNGVGTFNGGDVNVGGNIDAKDYAVKLEDGSRVNVAGNIKSESGTAVQTEIHNAEAELSPATLTVLGGITGSVEIQADEDVTVDDVVSRGSSIVTGYINVGEGKSIIEVTTAKDEDTAKAIAEKYEAEKIYYILNTEKIDNGTISFTKIENTGIEVKDAVGNVLKDANGNTIYATNAGKTVTISISAASGYEVKSASNGNSTLTKNTDGSYSLVVPVGGGVDIAAVIEAINNGDSGNSSSGSGDHVSSSDSGSPVVTNMDGTVIAAASTAVDWNYGGKNSLYGSAVSGWTLLDYKGDIGWYHFDSSLKRDTGWLQDTNGNWYYLNTKHDGTYGKMQTGLYTDPDSGYTYYFGQDGAMVTGAVYINNKLYFFNDGTVSSLPLGALVK